MKKSAIIVVAFLPLFVLGQVTVTNDGLDLTLEAGLVATIEGSYVNQTNGADLGTIDNAGTITLTHDWTNNSANTVFTANTGLTRFIGTANDQVIGGTNSTEFFNMELNNSFGSNSEFTFNRNTTVRNTFTMTDGVSDLNSTTLTLGVSAASPGTLSHGETPGNGYLRNGDFRRWFAAATVADLSLSGLFPVGGDPTRYKPVYISTPAVAPGVGGTITVARNAVGGNVGVNFADGAATVSVRQTSSWTISSGDGLTGGNYNMRITGNDYGNITDVADLRITLAASTIGTHGVTGGAPHYPFVTRTGLSLANLSNTFFLSSVASTNSPLPVELLHFTASLIDEESVELNWTTVVEINSSEFEIQHSTDGINFTTFARQNAAGNSLTQIDYNQYHYSPLNGTNYYRLKQIDFDGSYNYSNVEAIEIGIGLVAKAYPVPSFQNDIIVGLSGYEGEIKMEISDNSGRIIHKENHVISPGNSKLLLSTELFESSGIYHLIINYKGETKVQKLIYYE